MCGPPGGNPTDDDPVGRNSKLTKAFRRLLRHLGYTRGAVHFFLEHGLDVTTDLDYISNASRVKSDTCWNAVAFLGALLELLLRRPLDDELQKLGLALLLKPAPGSIADFVLQRGDDFFPVFMQERLGKAHFSVQPESVRLNGLVLLLARGRGLYVASGSDLQALAGTAAYVAIDSLPEGWCCRTVDHAAARIAQLVRVGKLTPLTGVQDSSALVRFPQLVAPHMLKSAEADALAQVLLDPLFAVMGIHSHKVTLETVPRGLAIRQPNLVTMYGSLLRLALGQRAVIKNIKFVATKTVAYLKSLVDVLQRSFQLHPAADEPARGSSSSSSSRPSAAANSLPAPVVQVWCQQQRLLVLQELGWLTGELSRQAAGVVNLLGDSAGICDRLGRVSQLLEQAVLSVAKMVAINSPEAAAAAAAAAAGKRVRVEWTPELSKALLKLLLQGVELGKVGTDLWEWVSQALFGTPKKARACESQQGLLARNLAWLDFEESKAHSANAVPGAPPQTESCTPAAIKATATRLADNEKLKAVLQVKHDPRRVAAGIEMGPTGDTLLNFIKVSSKADGGMVVGAVKEDAGNEISNFSGALAHSPVCALVDVTKAQLKLLSALKLLLAEAVSGREGVRGDPDRGNRTITPAVLAKVEPLIISLADTYPGLLQKTSAQQAAPDGLPDSTTPAAAINSVQGGSSSSKQGSGSDNTSSGSGGSPGSQAPTFVPDAFARLDSVAARIRSEDPAVRQQAVQELHALCGGEGRLEQVLSDLQSELLPATVQGNMSGMLQQFDTVLVQSSVLLLAAAGVNVFGQGATSGLCQTGKKSVDGWLAAQSQLLRMQGGVSVAATQQHSQHSTQQQASAALSEAGVGALQSVVTGIRSSGVMSPLSMLERCIYLRPAFTDRYGLQFARAASHLEGLGPDSGLVLSNGWMASLPYQLSRLLVASGLDSKAEAAVARNLLTAIAAPHLLLALLSTDGFSEPDKLGAACWLQVAADNGKPGASGVLRLVGENSPQLYEQMLQLTPEQLLHSATFVRFKYQLILPKPRFVHADRQLVNGAAAAAAADAAATPNALGAAAAGSSHRTRSGRVGSSSKAVSNSPASAQPSSTVPTLAAAGRRPGHLQARNEEKADAVMQALQGAGGGAAPLLPMLAKFYTARVSIKQAACLDTLLPPDVVLFKGKFKSDKGTPTPWVALSAAHAQSFRTSNYDDFKCSQEPQPFAQAIAPHLQRKRSHRAAASGHQPQQQQQQEEEEGAPSSGEQEAVGEEEQQQQQPRKRLGRAAASGHQPQQQQQEEEEEEGEPAAGELEGDGEEEQQQQQHSKRSRRAAASGHQPQQQQQEEEEEEGEQATGGQEGDGEEQQQTPCCCSQVR